MHRPAEAKKLEKGAYSIYFCTVTYFCSEAVSTSALILLLTGRGAVQPEDPSCAPSLIGQPAII
jgi:hypothetical protein